MTLMKNVMFLVLCLISSFFCRAELGIGDPAPALKAHWLKGTPIDKFEKGQVYVLEFWATWCGPCIAAMPHITKLAKQFAGKASFIGVNVFEHAKMDAGVVEKVEKFVKENSKKMGYSVCMDEAETFMGKNWMRAAGLNSIPATMIIDQDGKIAWIGHPKAMDKPLEAIIAGTWNAKAFAVTYKENKIEEKKRMEESKPVMAMLTAMNEAMAAKNYAAVIDSFASFPDNRYGKSEYLAPLYFKALAHTDTLRADKELMQLTDSTTKSAVFAALSGEEGLPVQFYRSVIEYYTAVKSVHPYNMASLAAAYFNAGETVKAVELQKKWVKWMKTDKEEPPPAWYVQMEEERLKKYKQALKK